MIQWGHDLVARAAARRDWKALPASFESDAVAFCFRQVKPHFDKRNSRERINASRATTFDELKAALKPPAEKRGTPAAEL